ncbi:VOC family protein [Changchengzhania lutea]|uniref:VOC family protein n=1 Tax=Changchengzhania lutea TaxID=2049305 RepID=UPI00115DF81F|nr:VOC family protein [Changchengzhania lutea]
MNLNQITISSLDVEKAAAFYKILGLRLIVDSAPKYVRFECPDGDATFSIHQVKELPKGNRITIYFEDDNLDEWVSQLLEKGIIFLQLPINMDWLWREAHLQDPDGNHIILFHAGKNRKNPPWQID